MPNLKEFRPAMNSIAELATALDERGACLTIQKESEDDDDPESPEYFVVFLWSQASPSANFSNTDPDLGVAIKGVLEEWDADSEEVDPA